MALTDNLVSYWKLDEASGNAADAHGSNTLVNNGSAAYAAGKINNGIDLEDGSSQFLKAADSASLDITANLSISMWLKLESFGAVVLASKYDDDVGADRGWIAQYRGDLTPKRFNIEYRDGPNSGTTDSTRADYNTDLSTGTWVHAVITIATASHVVKVYVNGTPNTATNSVANADSIQAGAAGFRLGALGLSSSSEAGFYDGMFDEVGLWSKILSDAEVTELYNAGAGLAYPFTVAASGSGRHMLMGVGQ